MKLITISVQALDGEKSKQEEGKVGSWKIEEIGNQIAESQQN